MHETRVDQKVFEKFPSFRRGIVVARKMKNQGVSKQLEALLYEALAEASSSPIDLTTDPRTAIWNDTYRELGCNPKKFPPAHLALLKRVQKPGVSIPFINKAVAIMNDNSIRGVLPVGGDDIHRAGKILELSFADGKEIMCRRWNWRNGFQTRITEETEAMVMNIDGLGENSEKRAILVRDRVAGMLEQYCNAEVETALLTPYEPVFPFRL